MVDFIGIGAQKAGTTWLFGQLHQHPDVVFSPVKEVRYFDALGNETAMRKGRDRMAKRCALRIEELAGSTDPLASAKIARLRRAMDPGFMHTDEWYAFLFEHVRGDQKGGDITPAYSALPEEEVAHVWRLAPQARLIYLVRDPVARGISSLKMMTRSKSAEEVLASRRYFDLGDYETSIKRWERRFEGQLLCLPFGDIRTRPLELMREVEQHIGLRPFDNYQNVSEPVASTGTWSTLEITPEIEGRIRELFAPQYDFLRQRFGDDFVARIR